MLPAVHHALKSHAQPPQVRKHASSIRTLVLLGVAAMFCAVLAPISALWLLQLAEVDRSNDAVLTWGASEAAHLDQCSMGGGADCEVDATYTTPEARSVGSFCSPILRTTQTDSRNIVGSPSKGRRTSSKLIGTLLATVAAAPVALAVRGFRGTASSPKTMGRVLVTGSSAVAVSSAAIAPATAALTTDALAADPGEHGKVDEDSAHRFGRGGRAMGAPHR